MLRFWGGDLLSSSSAMEISTRSNNEIEDIRNFTEDQQRQYPTSNYTANVDVQNINNEEQRKVK